MGVGQAQLFRHVAAHVAGERIGRADQIVQDGPRLRLGQVQRQAFLVAVEAVEELAVAGREEVRADGAGHVAAVARVFDLDDLGALVGQEHGAERPGPVLLHRKHADSLERQHGGYTGFRAMSCFAMIRRCNSLVPSPIASNGASR